MAGVNQWLVITVLVLLLVECSSSRHQRQRHHGRRRLTDVSSTDHSDHSDAAAAAADDGRSDADVDQTAHNARRTHSRRQSTWRRWLDRIRPHGVHGSLRFRRGQEGHGLDVDTGLNWDFDWRSKWWTRENVCVHVTETLSSDTGRYHRLSYTRTCNETLSTNQYTCTTVQVRGRRVRTTTDVYKCCHGYRLLRHSSAAAASCVEDNGSNSETERSSLIVTLQSLGATHMLRALNLTGLLQLLQTTYNYTLFAPTDEAFAGFTPRMVTDLTLVRASPQQLNTLSDELSDVIARHVVPGHVLVADQSDSRLIASRNIWLNKYTLPDKQVVTANCVRLLYADVMANNGVVHVVEQVLPSADNSLQHLIRTLPQLTVFATMLETLQLDEGGPHNNGSYYTVFAPSNLAFDQVQPSVRDKLLNQHAGSCGPDIMRQHVIRDLVCSSSVSDGNSLSLHNVAGRYVTLTRQPPQLPLMSSQHGQLVIEGATVSQSDIVASNGVLHIIDQVLFHTAVDGLLGVVKRSDEAREFVRLMELTGMTERLQQMHEFTIFFPSDSAIRAMSGSLNRLNREELTRLVEYHIIPEQRVTAADLQNDVTLTSLLNSQQLLIKQYHSFPFSRRSRIAVQCAPVIQADIHTDSVCSGVGHVIGQVMVPSTSSMYDLLSNNSQYSFLVELVHIAGLTELLQQQELPITFFAPTNQAFETLPAELVSRLMSDENAARRLVRSHIIRDRLCCAGVFSSEELLQLPVREVNMDCWMIPVKRSRQQTTVTYGDVTVASCDHTANNGVVHVINSFVPAAISRHLSTPRPPAVRSRQSGRSTTGITLHLLWDVLKSRLP